MHFVLQLEASAAGDRSRVRKGAVALGELVDDAIVDVESIFRRLRMNARLDNPRPALAVIYESSVEVRSAIVISTRRPTRSRRPSQMSAASPRPSSHRSS